MRRATTDSGAAGRTSDRRAGRAVEERRSRAGVDEDLVVAPSGGEAVEKERHRGRPRGPGLGDVGRQPQMAQDALDHGGVFDHRNELQAPATPGAFEDIEPKAPADELRPETVRRGRGVPSSRRIPGVFRRRILVGADGFPESDHVGPPRRARGQHAIVENQVDARPRCQRGEALEQFHGGQTADA